MNILALDMATKTGWAKTINSPPALNKGTGSEHIKISNQKDRTRL